MALVVGDVNHASAARRFLWYPNPLVEPLDLSQDGIERVLEGAIDRIALRRPEFVEVGVNPLARIELGLAMSAPKITGDILSRENGLRDVVEHHASSARQTASVNSVVVAVPPRSRVRT